MSNNCYISTKDIKEIIDTQNLNENSISSFMVIVNNIYNVSEITKKLSELNYFYDIKNNIDVDILDIINLCAKIFCTILVVIVILTTIFYVKKKIKEDKFYIGILKVSGYNNKMIQLIYLIELFIIFSISFIIGTIIIFLSYLILKNTILNFLIYFGYEIQFSMYILFLTFIFIVILPLLISFYYLYIETKKNISFLLENEEVQ